MGRQGLLVWKGKDTDQRIFWSRASSNGNFDQQQQVRYFATNRGLAAARDPETRLMTVAWKGADADTRIWLATYDRDSWSDQRLPNGTPRTADRPALVFYKGKMVMAWRGAGSDERIWYSENWLEQKHAGNGLASSTHGPALAVYRDRLFMAWKGSGNNQNLYWTTYDGARWEDPRPFPGGSTHGPALAAARDHLVMAWKGSGSDDRLFRASYKNSWSPQTLAVGGSSRGPALGVLETDIGAPYVVMAWKGIAGDARLWWSDDYFRSQRPVAGGAFGTSDTPALVSVTVMNL